MSKPKRRPTDKQLIEIVARAIVGAHHRKFGITRAWTDEEYMKTGRIYAMEAIRAMRREGSK